jgi:V8-like Glu-specific endopeptidase
MDRVRGVILAAIGAASLFAATTPSVAAGAALSSHRVAAGAGTARFWTPGRVRAALLRGSPGDPRAASDQIARASSVGVDDATAVDERMNGRIFAVDPREGPYSCSGTALDTPGRSIVLTAGHCVVENRSWGTHIVFVPAFDHGARPFATYTADTVYTTPQWRRSENNDYDVAALHVQPNALGTLEDVVGARGFAYNRSRYLRLAIFGYPAGALDGQQLRECKSLGLGSDPLTFGLSGPPTLPARCDMAAGSSGGSWVTPDGLIDGVTSYSYDGSRNRLYSPYFGTSVGNFLKHLP